MRKNDPNLTEDAATDEPSAEGSGALSPDADSLLDGQAEEATEQSDVEDIAGLALADQIDELLLLANSPQGNLGTGNDSPSKVEDLFSTPEQVIAEAEEKTEKSSEHAAGEATPDTGESQTKKGVDVDPNVGAHEDDSKDMQSTLAGQDVSKAALDEVGDDVFENTGGGFETVDDVIAASSEAENKNIEVNEINTDTAIGEDADLSASPSAESSVEPSDKSSTESSSELETNAPDAAVDLDHDNLDASFETVTEVLETSNTEVSEPPEAGATPANVMDAPVLEDELPSSDEAAVSVDASEAETDADFGGSFETVDDVVSEPDAPEPDTEVVAENVSEAVDQPSDESVAAPEASSLPIGQIDELLAEQADTAVAGDFETPGEILAAEQAADVNTEDAPPLDEFATFEDIAGDADSKPKSIDSGTIMEAPLLPSDDVEPVDGEVSIDQIDETELNEEEVEFEPAAEIDLAEEQSANSGRSLPSGLLGRVVRICTDNVYRFCEMTNRPLKGASDSTRRMVGLIGLITLANASMIMIGKIVFSMIG